MTEGDEYSCDLTTIEESEMTIIEDELDKACKDKVQLECNLNTCVEKQAKDTGTSADNSQSELEEGVLHILGNMMIRKN